MRFTVRHAAAALLLAGAGAAQAAAVSFSFSNTAGNANGTVSGRLLGLADSGTSAATSIFIDSAPADAGFGAFPVDILSLGWTLSADTLTITNGMVTGVDIEVASANGSRAPKFFLNFANSVNQLNNIAGRLGVLNSEGFEGITFNVALSETAVPEPATILLAAVALAGLGVSRQRGRQAA